MGKTSVRWIALGLVALVLVVLGIRRWVLPEAQANDQTKEEEASTDAAPTQEQAALPVTIEVLQTEKLVDMLTVSGTLEADETVEVSSEIAGKVQQIYFQEGSYVQAGQTLVKLNDDDLQAELNKVQYQRDLAQQQEKRRRQLLEKGGLSQEEYDQALTEVNTLEAEIELLKVRIEKTTITAPFSGRIGFRYVSEGSYLSPGTRIATLVKISPIKVSFTIPERYALKMKPGLPISYTIEGLKDTMQARVYARTPTIDPTTRTLEVKAQGTNPGGKLSPGAFATVTVQLDAFPDAVMIPNRAVMPERDQQIVYRYAAGTAQPATIQTGIRRADRVQVVEGLQVGDTIITSGLIQMRPGLEVAIEAD